MSYVCLNIFIANNFKRISIRCKKLSTKAKNTEKLTHCYTMKKKQGLTKVLCFLFQNMNKLEVLVMYKIVSFIFSLMACKLVLFFI